MRTMLCFRLFFLAIVLGTSTVLDANSNKEVVVNNANVAKSLKQAVGREKGGALTETMNFDPPVCVEGKGGSVRFDYATLTCGVLISTTWCNKPSRSSKQNFIDADDLGVFTYTVMLADAEDVEYSLSQADLTATLPVPEGAAITVVNGIDQTGAFPPGVVFRIAGTSTPFEGELTSAGAIQAFSPAPLPSTSVRNGGSNPLSYSSTPFVLGETVTFTVDLSTTGHFAAIAFALDTPFPGLVLAGGQTLLCIDSGLGELLTGHGLPLGGNPIATTSATVPSSAALLGFSFCSQAIHFGSGVGAPFAISNALDITVGL